MNTKINEDYCDFETAKLLKEKRFDENINTYRDDFILHGSIVIPLQECVSKDRVKTPTLQMAMKWLRKVHHIHANPIRQGSYDDLSEDYSWIVARDGIIYRNQSVSKRLSYEEACEAAIKYCLTNLI